MIHRQRESRTGDAVFTTKPKPAPPPRRQRRRRPYTRTLAQTNRAPSRHQLLTRRARGALVGGKPKGTDRGTVVRIHRRLSLDMISLRTPLLTMSRGTIVLDYTRFHTMVTPHSEQDTCYVRTFSNSSARTSSETHLVTHLVLVLKAWPSLQRVLERELTETQTQTQRASPVQRSLSPPASSPGIVGRPAGVPVELGSVRGTPSSSAGSARASQLRRSRPSRWGRTSVGRSCMRHDDQNIGENCASVLDSHG